MKNIGIIGMGNMGEAILNALLRNGFEKDSILCAELKPDRAEYIRKTHAITCIEKPHEVLTNTDYCIVAVKPQDSKALLQGIAPFLTDRQVLISIMAGITTSNILAIMGKQSKIVRIMPNVCVKVGEGAMALSANAAVDAKDVEEIKKIFSSMGKVVDIGEHLMDAVTAVGGSGPAFVLLFLEAMIDGGVKMGLPRDKAAILSIQVVKGTIQMLEEENLHPTLMKEMITSPGGTTIAGLASLEDGAFKGNVMRAVQEAAKRSKELSQ